MIVTLRHEIEIEAPPEKVYAFFENIEENYTKWHPDHRVFRWMTEGGLKQGAVAYSEQMVGGKLHKLRARFTKVVPNHLVEFKWVNPISRFIAPRNTRVFEATDTGCKFIAEGDIRLGWISSRMKRVRAALDQGRVHLKEEGENLKQLVEQVQ
jgi:uncharacterized protein YndB with AHSA1/START domain